MDEVLTLAEQKSPFHDLIIRYGKLVEETMGSIGSRERAKRFVEDTCRAFNYQCENEIIRSGFRKYVLNIFEKYRGGA